MAKSGRRNRSSGKRKEEIRVTPEVTLTRLFTFAAIAIAIVGIGFGYCLFREEGKREAGDIWAVLIAGSNGFKNYRHQADICRSYHLLLNGGVKRENIIVFMYDDVAFHPKNPLKGVLLTTMVNVSSLDARHIRDLPQNVYNNVPKDYTGDDITAANIYNVLLGHKKHVRGGSGRVVESRANDRIFVYFSGHGAKQKLGLPSEPDIEADTILRVLKKMNAMRRYTEMLIYVESCKAGTVFEELPQNLNIFVMTASGHGKSYASECIAFKDFQQAFSNSPVLDAICFTNHFSDAWMFDSETKNRRARTVGEQFLYVKKKVARFSVVKGFGDVTLKTKVLSLFQGSEPERVFVPEIDGFSLLGVSRTLTHVNDTKVEIIDLGIVPQREVQIFLLQQMYLHEKDPMRRLELQLVLNKTSEQRTRLDARIQKIAGLLLGPPTDHLAADADCAQQAFVKFEAHCGEVDEYDLLKYEDIFEYLCIGRSFMEIYDACKTAC